MNVAADPGSRVRAVGLSAWAVAISAFGGTLGLVTGGLTLGSDLDHRLPFHSPVLGGLALAALVGIPYAVLGVSCRRRDRRVGRLSMAVGALLVAWIIVELLFLRELSFFHPLYAAIGLAFMWAGRRVEGT